MATMYTFAYLRVSTADQTTENQACEIAAALGRAPDATYADVVSGKIKAEDRPDFAKLLDTIERTTTRKKQLIVTKLDRLGRDAIDIMSTVRRLSGLGCAVKVLQLGDLDLTSSAGKLVLSTIAAVAEMERDLIVERTQAGLARAKAEGKTLGRPKKVTAGQEQDMVRQLTEGVSVAQVARDHSVSRMTVMRIRDKTRCGKRRAVKLTP